MAAAAQAMEIPTDTTRYMRTNLSVRYLHVDCREIYGKDISFALLLLPQPYILVLHPYVLHLFNVHGCTVHTLNTQHTKSNTNTQKRIFISLLWQWTSLYSHTYTRARARASTHTYLVPFSRIMMNMNRRKKRETNEKENVETIATKRNYSLLFPDLGNSLRFSQQILKLPNVSHVYTEENKFFSQTLYKYTAPCVQQEKTSTTRNWIFPIDTRQTQLQFIQTKMFSQIPNAMRCDTRTRTRNNCAIFSIQFMKKLITFSIRRVRIDIIASNTTENFVTLNGEKILFWFKTICAWNGVVAAECSVAVRERNEERKMPFNIDRNIFEKS